MVKIEMIKILTGNEIEEAVKETSRILNYSIVSGPGKTQVEGLSDVCAAEIFAETSDGKSLDIIFRVWKRGDGRVECEEIVASSLAFLEKAYVKEGNIVFEIFVEKETERFLFPIEDFNL